MCQIIEKLPFIRTEHQIPPDEDQLYIVVAVGDWIEGDEIIDGSEGDEKLVNPIITLNWGICIKNFPSDFPYWMPFINQSSFLYRNESLPEYRKPNSDWYKVTSEWLINSVGIVGRHNVRQ